MTDIFKCDKSKTCCSPKTAIKEREAEIKRIDSQKNVIYSNSIDRNDTGSFINGIEGNYYRPGPPVGNLGPNHGGFALQQPVAQVQYTQ